MLYKNKPAGRILRLLDCLKTSGSIIRAEFIILGAHHVHDNAIIMVEMNAVILRRTDRPADVREHGF